MVNAISVFKFNQNQIRTQSVDGNPWFCLLDCCKALGIKNAAVPKADSWEVSDADLIRVLHNWHHTKNKKETEDARRLHAEIDMLRQKLSDVKKAVQ